MPPADRAQGVGGAAEAVRGWSSAPLVGQNIGQPAARRTRVRRTRGARAARNLGWGWGSSRRKTGAGRAGLRDRAGGEATCPSCRRPAKNRNLRLEMLTAALPPLGYRQTRSFSAVAGVSGAPRGSHSRCDGDGAKSCMMANMSQPQLGTKPRSGRCAESLTYLKYLNLKKEENINRHTKGTAEGREPPDSLINTVRLGAAHGHAARTPRPTWPTDYLATAQKEVSMHAPARGIVRHD